MGGAQGKPEEDKMFNDHGLLRLGELRTAELRKEAEQYRLANAVRRRRSYPAAVRISAIACLTALGTIVFVLAR
jgi:hypothetical protein